MKCNDIIGRYLIHVEHCPWWIYCEYKTLSMPMPLHGTYFWDIPLRHTSETHNYVKHTSRI